MRPVGAPEWPWGADFCRHFVGPHHYSRGSRVAGFASLALTPGYPLSTFQVAQPWSLLSVRDSGTHIDQVDVRILSGGFAPGAMRMAMPFRPRFFFLFRLCLICEA